MPIPHPLVVVADWAVIDRRPLWPAEPPPTFDFTFPVARSSSS